MRRLCLDGDVRLDQLDPGVSSRRRERRVPVLPFDTHWNSEARELAAVEKIDHVESVSTDMDAHTLTVSFDDEHVSIENVVEVLGVAGYTVPNKRLLN